MVFNSMDALYKKELKRLLNKMDDEEGDTENP
jgi:hypothetical protein